MSAYTTSVFYPDNQGSVTGPYLLPPNYPTTFTNPLELWIATVCGGSTNTNTPGIGTSAAQPVFSLSFQQAPSSGTGPWFAVVNVAASYVFSADAGVRAQMLAAYSQFRAQLEALEYAATAPQSNQAGLIPGGATLVANRVATNMPLRFDEVLPYVYGFNATGQYIDLVPGMVVRAEWGGYQFCNAPPAPGAALNSFVAAGVGRYPITRNRDGLVALDAFIDSFAGYALSPAATCPLFAQGLIDLEVGGNARRHLRLFFPTVVGASGSVSNGGLNTQMGSRLIGAETYADLLAATTDVLAGGTGCGKAASGSAPIVSIAFNGRVVLVPEFAYSLDGVTASAPVGTTLRNLLEAIADPTPAQFFPSSGSSVALTLARWNQSIVVPGTGPNLNVLAQVAVSFGAAPAVAGPLGDWFDMPILKGDAVMIGASVGTPK